MRKEGYDVSLPTQINKCLVNQEVRGVKLRGKATPIQRTFTAKYTVAIAASWNSIRSSFGPFPVDDKYLSK